MLLTEERNSFDKYHSKFYIWKVSSMSFIFHHMLLKFLVLNFYCESGDIFIVS